MNKILELLEKNRGTSLSGEQIAGFLGVSRAAVWKGIEALRRDGHIIDAVTNRGYALSDGSGVLSVEGLLPYLSDGVSAENIHIYKTLESTNKTAKEMAMSGCVHGTVVIADTQTAGRGRHGREFYSPADSGLYISIVLHPNKITLPDITMITSAAAVAVCRAVKSVTGVDAGIKWVNDILSDGKKICGILTEAVTDLESGNIDWLVTGIGVNITTESFPDEIKHIATSVRKTAEVGIVPSMRSRLAAELINILLTSNLLSDVDVIHKEYKERLVVLGREITVIQGDERYTGVATDVDKSGHLIVKKPDGSVVSLFSGEVSTKL